MKNTLNDGFVQLYTENEKFIPSFSLKEGKGELKNAIESTADQFTDVDPIDPQSIPSGTVVSGAGEPTIKEDVPSIGEKIIADDDDVLVRPLGDESAPAGSDVSVKTVEVADAAGLSGFLNPIMDDFLGEQEGTGDEEKGDKDITPEEVVNREMCNHLISDSFNSLNSTVFENASDILAQKIGHTYESFKQEIVPEVKKIQSKILEETNKMLNANGSSQLAESLEIEAPTVTMINWNELNTLGSKDEIIAGAKSFGKLKMTDVMNFNASRSTTRMWLPRLEEVNIPSSVGNSIVRKLETEIGENVEEAGIITASNPDTPEGQVAAGNEYLKRIFNKNQDIVAGAESIIGAVTVGTIVAGIVGAFVYNKYKNNQILKKLKQSSKMKIVEKAIETSFNNYKKLCSEIKSKAEQVLRKYEKYVTIRLSDDIDYNDSVEDFGKYLIKAVVASIRHKEISSDYSVDRNQISVHMGNVLRILFDDRGTYDDVEFNQVKREILKFITVENKQYMLTYEEAEDPENVEEEQTVNFIFSIGAWIHTGITKQMILEFATEIETAKKEESSEGTEAFKLETEGGFNVTTDDTDKQTEAHSPEKALEVSKESFELMMKDRKISGGVRLGNKNIFTKYMNLLEKNTDKDNFKYLNSVFFPILKKTKKEVLPEDKTKVIDKSFALSVMDYFNKNTFKVKDLIVKLKLAADDTDPSDADVNSISNAAEEMHKELNTLLNTDVAKTDNVYPSLAKQLKDTSIKSSTWMVDDVRNIRKDYTDLSDNYRAFFKDITNLYNANNLKDSNKNKVFNYGYYMVETMCGLFSTLYNAIMSTCMSVVDAYETGVKNSYDSEAVASLMTIHTMDDFLGEDEGTEKDNKDGEDHLDTANESIYINKLYNEITLISGTEGIKEGFQNFVTKVKEFIKKILAWVPKFVKIIKDYISGKSKVIKTLESLVDKCPNSVKYEDSKGTHVVPKLESVEAFNKLLEEFIRKSNNTVVMNSEDSSLEIEFHKELVDFSNEHDSEVNRKDEYSTKAKVKQLCAVAIKISSNMKTFENKAEEISNICKDVENQLNQLENSNKTERYIDDRDRLKLSLEKIKNRYKIYNSIISEVGYFLKDSEVTIRQFIKASGQQIEKGTPLTSTESRSVSREVYNIVSKHSGYYEFARKMNSAMRAMNTGHQVPEMLRVVNKYPKVLQKLATMDFGISLNDGESIKKNANTVREMLNCIGLHLLVCKQYFDTNNVLLLDATHANPDTFEEFKKQDGSMEDVNLHLLHRYILPKQPVPNTGIRISEILRNKQNVALEHIKRTESIKDKVRINHDGASVLAYTRVLSDYLKEIPQEYIPKGMTRQNFVNMKYPLVKATSQYLNSKDHSVDECLYRFLLKLKYNDSPMYQDMYNKMEIQYRRLAESTESSITPADKATADAKVVSDIVMNFLFDYFVEK